MCLIILDLITHALKVNRKHQPRDETPTKINEKMRIDNPSKSRDLSTRHVVKV